MKKAIYTRKLIRNSLAYWDKAEETAIDFWVPGYWHMIAEYFTHE